MYTSSVTCDYSLRCLENRSHPRIPTLFFFFREEGELGRVSGSAAPPLLLPQFPSPPPNARSMSSKAPCCALRVRGASSFHTSTPNVPPQFTVTFLPALWSGNGLYHSFVVSFSTVPPLPPLSASRW